MRAQKHLPVFITSSNPQLKGLIKNKDWILKSAGHRQGGGAYRKRKKLDKASSANRLTYSFKLRDEDRKIM